MKPNKPRLRKGCNSVYKAPWSWVPGLPERNPDVATCQHLPQTDSAAARACAYGLSEGTMAEQILGSDHRDLFPVYLCSPELRQRGPNSVIWCAW